MSDEEENEDEGINYTRAYAIGAGLISSSKEKRKKQIEESVAENEKLKTELLTNINTFLLDVAISEKWWSRLRKAVESMVINPDTQTIILLLTRDEEKEDVWTVEGIVSSEKGKGTKYIKVNFGDKPKKD